MLEQEIQLAIQAVQQASRLCRRVRADFRPGQERTKDDRSPVTVADYGAQVLVSRALAEVFPDDPLVGEEQAEALRPGGDQASLLPAILQAVKADGSAWTADEMLEILDRGGFEGGRGRFWTLDPIDGTKGFLRGEQYAVALALLEYGEPALGVLGCPNLDGGETGSGTGVLFYALRGKGAHAISMTTGRRISLPVCAARVPMEQAVFCESVESGHSAHGASAQVAEKLGTRAEPVRLDSQCKYAVVARGDAHLYLRLPTRADYREKIWDHAAGALLVQECGGKVTDARGLPLDFSLGRTLDQNQGVVASRGIDHDQVIRVVQDVLAGNR